MTGFFSDEVGFLDGHGASIDKGGIPWCEEAAEQVRAELGEFRPELLFCDAGRIGGDALALLAGHH